MMKVNIRTRILPTSRTNHFCKLKFLPKRPKKCLEFKNKFDQYEDCISLGKELIGKHDVTGVVRDRVKTLENQWHNLESVLDEKMKLFKQKAQQFNAYETLKDKILQWLTNFEKKTNSLQSVAIDFVVVKRQADDVKPISKKTVNMIEQSIESTIWVNNMMHYSSRQSKW